jgi:hypothetical protein
MRSWITFNDIKPLDFEMKNKKTCKGVSKVVVDKEINNDDYKEVLNTNSILRKDVISIRSFNHKVFTIKQYKVALTSFYDKMRLESPIECVPFGYSRYYITLSIIGSCLSRILFYNLHIKTYLHFIINAE